MGGVRDDASALKLGAWWRYDRAYKLVGSTTRRDMASDATLGCGASAPADHMGENPTEPRLMTTLFCNFLGWRHHAPNVRTTGGPKRGAPRALRGNFRSLQEKSQ